MQIKTSWATENITTGKLQHDLFRAAVKSLECCTALCQAKVSTLLTGKVLLSDTRTLNDKVLFSDRYKCRETKYTAVN